MHFLILAAIGLWLAIEGVTAMLFAYPPAFWVVIRVLRIMSGGALLLEAREARLRYEFDEKDNRRQEKMKHGYIDLVTVVGVWTAVDGIGTGFFGYEYPIVIWQLIRLARVAMGLGLVFGCRYFLPKLGRA